jgi:hypothetical protein
VELPDILREMEPVIDRDVLYGVGTAMAVSASAAKAGVALA